MDPYRIAELGYVAATFMSGFGARACFDACRASYAEAHGRPAPRDTVVDQAARFHDAVGGFDHLPMRMGGRLTFEDAADSLRPFTRDVCPRLKS